MATPVTYAAIDDICRDVAEVRRLRFPLFSKGITSDVAAIAG